MQCGHATVAAAVEPTGTGTCRCLFGAADRADAAATLASLRASLDRLSAARWAFDFAAGRPLAGGRFHWTEVAVDRRMRCAGPGSDVRDRPALQPVNAETTTSSPVTSSDRVRTASSTRRRSVVTSSRRGHRRRPQKITGFDDVTGNVVVCAPASQQHRNAKCRRHIMTSACLIARWFITRFLY